MRNLQKKERVMKVKKMKSRRQMMRALGKRENSLMLLMENLMERKMRLKKMRVKMRAKMRLRNLGKRSNLAMRS